jgi:hypothetical protein
MVRCKKSICFIFGISLVVLLGSLWWLQVTTVKESFDVFNNAWVKKATLEVGVPAAAYLQRNTQYINIGDEEYMRAKSNNMVYLESVKNPTPAQSVQIATYNPSVFKNDTSIFISNPRTTGVSSTTRGDADYSISEITTDIMNNNNYDKIPWDDIRVDALKKNRITLAPRIKKPYILIDACSTNSTVNSDFKEDVCELYAGNYEVINAKCEKLSGENCKIPSCCVLLNGTKCVAGNQNGPIYKDMDYKYYVNKNNCYGNCNQEQTFSSACKMYTNNSIGVSKECMIEMFNSYGCPNKNPTEVVNDDIVKEYSKTTKQFVDFYIRTSADIFKKQNKAICNGSGPAQSGAPTAAATSTGASSLNDMSGAITSTISSMTSF